MENQIFNTVFENATTKKQVNDAFSEAIDALLKAKAERMELVASGKAKKAPKKTEAKTEQPKVEEPKTTKAKAKTEKKSDIKDAAVIHKTVKGVQVVDLDMALVKKLKLHYQNHDDKRFWVYGDTKQVTSFLMAHKGRFYQADRSQCKDDNGNPVDAWIFWKQTKDGVNTEATLRKAFSI